MPLIVVQPPHLGCWTSKLNSVSMYLSGYGCIYLSVTLLLASQEIYFGLARPDNAWVGVTCHLLNFHLNLKDVHLSGYVFGFGTVTCLSMNSFKLKRVPQVNTWWAQTYKNKPTNQPTDRRYISSFPQILNKSYCMDHHIKGYPTIFCPVATGKAGPTIQLLYVSMDGCV